MEQMCVFPFCAESMLAVVLLTVVTVTLQDDSGYCFVQQDGEAPISECDPFVYAVGGSLHLPCHNLSSLHPLKDGNNFEWYKDGRVLDNHRGFNFTKSSLQIADSGHYLCLVESQYSFRYKVLVGSKPPRKAPKPRCTSSDIGTYTCAWSTDFINDTNLPTRFQLQFSEEGLGHKWEYFNASSEDNPATVTVNSTRARFFVSLCIANCLGQAISNPVMVSPELTYVPLPPRHVQMIPISVDQMNVSFDPPLLKEDEHLKYRYHVTQERTPFAVWEKAMVSDTLNNTFALNVERKPFSKVCIKVAAYHNYIQPVKISQYTTPVCSYTQMSAPSVGPPHFTFQSMPDGQRPKLRKVNFTWEHLNADEANGIIIKYTLILSITNSSPATDSRSEVHTIPPSDLSFIAEGVQTQLEYRAELYAENAAGQSPPSIKTVFMASDGEVFSINLLLVMAIMVSFGFLLAGLRLFFSIKERVLPEVPEPLLNSQLFQMRMKSSPTPIEKEVFDKLHCPEECTPSTSTSQNTAENSSGYFGDQVLTQSLLANKAEDPYIQANSVCRAVTAATNTEGGYIGWK